MAIKYFPGTLPTVGTTGQSSQQRACTVGADVAGVGTSAWTNPGNITALDGNYALAATTAVSHWLQATGFGFSIPSGVIITGVVATFYKKGDGNESDFAVKLVKGGVVQAGDRSIPGAWPNAVFTQNYGSSKDLWGAALTPADINAANFGVALSASVIFPGGAQVDYVTMSVYYMLPFSNQPNMIDDVTLPTAFASQRTTGGTLLVIDSNQPSGSQKWKIIAVSLHGFLALHATAPLYGKLGKLTGAVMIDPVGAVSPVQSAAFTPMPTADRSLAGTLWDPAIDAFPPPFTGSSGSPAQFSEMLHCDAVITPPVARDVLPGTQISVALYLEPSLLGSGVAGAIGGLYLFNTRYGMVIDDGA